jgi:GR25 family glycosyltransferase involved in LPS biosynthesis
MDLTTFNTICINLKNRKDKRKKIKLQAKRRDIKLDFYTAKLNKDPKRGCLESHLNVIENAINKGIKQLLILEDDAKIINPIKNLKSPPSNWDMLYLGGTVHRIINKDNDNWTRVTCWTTHAYIINLENKELINEIRKAKDYKNEIDRFYLENIHKNFNVYMCNPMSIIQEDGYSDIEGRYVNYDFMQKTLSGLTLPEYENKDGNYVLKLPNIEDKDLPNISIITPTYNRRKFYSLLERNINNFIYPKEKIEWIIIDDSENDENSIEDLIPVKSSIKYLRIKPRDDEKDTFKKLSIAYKRNLGVQRAKNDIIVHIDDDDYYPPESILARVKLLLKYKEKGIRCVGCSQIGTYDLLNNKSSLSSDGPINFSEASMAYFKDFWVQKQFTSTQLKGEHKDYMESRLHNCMDIPYAFVIIAFTHNNNYTSYRKIDKNVLKFKSTNKEANFYDTWDEDTRYFIDELRNYIIK